MSWIKTASLNLIIFVILWGAVELSYKAYKLLLSENVECEKDWIAYGYCNNIITSNTNHKEDGGAKIIIKVDELGARIDPSSSMKVINPKLVLIGDSFIQADEIRYEETVYGRLNAKLDGKVYALGYSSWNPIQYHDAIKKLGINGAHYIVFLMGNDVNPLYSRSVHGERTLANRQVDYSLVTTLKNMLKDTVLWRGYALLKMKLDSGEVNSQNNSESLQVVDSFREKDWLNCDPLKSIYGTRYSEKLGFDYLVYSKNVKCWDEERKEAYGEFLAEVKALNEYVTKTLKGRVSYVWVSAGWAFENQNSLGRLDSSYQFPVGIAVSQKGVLEKFKNDMDGADIVSTESLLRDAIDNCTDECVDKFYYSVDGHWTPEAHSVLAKYIINRYASD